MNLAKAVGTALLALLVSTRAQGAQITLLHNDALSWNGALTGALCQIQWTPSLSAEPARTVWTTLKTVLVTNSTMTADVPAVSATNTSRFYRLLAEPAAEISLRYTSGPPGSVNAGNAYGYAPGEYVLYYNGSYVGYGMADSNGYCSANFKTPYYNTNGTYNVAGMGQTSELSASSSFNQNAALVTLLQTTGAPGSANTAYAYGYAAGEYMYFTTTGRTSAMALQPATATAARTSRPRPTTPAARTT